MINVSSRLIYILMPTAVSNRIQLVLTEMSKDNIIKQNFYFPIMRHVSSEIMKKIKSLHVTTLISQPELKSVAFSGP